MNDLREALADVDLLDRAKELVLNVNHALQGPAHSFSEAVDIAKRALAAQAPKPSTSPVPSPQDRKDVNDLCEAISRIRWARGTDKLDAAIFEAVRVQSIIDASHTTAPASLSTGRLEGLPTKWRNEPDYSDSPHTNSAFKAGLRIAAIELEGASETSCAK